MATFPSTPEPSYGLTKNSAPITRVVKFADGYEHRIQLGLSEHKNPKIYKDLKSPVNQQFEKLLNSQLSKNKIEEGKIIDGKITKITDKFVFILIVLF